MDLLRVILEDKEILVPNIMVVAVELVPLVHLFQIVQLMAVLVVMVLNSLSQDLQHTLQLVLLIPLLGMGSILLEVVPAVVVVLHQEDLVEVVEELLKDHR